MQEMLTIIGIAILVQLSYLLGYIAGQRNIAEYFHIKLQPPPKDSP